MYKVSYLMDVTFYDIHRRTNKKYTKKIELNLYCPSGIDFDDQAMMRDIMHTHDKKDWLGCGRVISWQPVGCSGVKLSDEEAREAMFMINEHHTNGSVETRSCYKYSLENQAHAFGIDLFRQAELYRKYGWDGLNKMYLNYA